MASKTVKIIAVLIISIILISSGWWIFTNYIQSDGDSEYNPPTYIINNQNISSFGYLLQYENYGSRAKTIGAIRDSAYDLFILEPYYSADSQWTPEELNEMRSEQNNKILLAYISIGEAENYRSYWNESWDANNDGIPDPGAPEWLDIENPDWEGNYKVKYWMEEWQQIIFGTNSSGVDKIIAQGFDGIYMDIIDAYEYYEEKGIDEAGQWMVDFVGKISNYTKEINPNFLIFPQNGEHLAADYPEYLNYIDGIGREDVRYNGNLKTSDEDYEYVLSDLLLFKNSNKIVLEVEYPTINAYIEECYITAQENGFLCYVGPRDLATIQYNEGFLPN